MKVITVFKWTFIVVIISTLTACEQSSNTVNNIHLPDLPLNINTASFELIVRNQIQKHIDYINVTKKHTDEPIKIGWAVGQLCKTYKAYKLHLATIDCLLNAINLNPQNYEWHYLLADEYNIQGGYENAIKFYTIAHDLTDYLPAVIGKAKALILKNQFNDAELILNKLLLEYPEHPLILYNLSTILIHKKDFKRAEKYLLKILETQPNAYQPHYQLGQLYSQKMDREKASYHLDKLSNNYYKRINIFSKDPLLESVSEFNIGSQSMLTKAKKALALGQYKKAVRLLKQTININPTKKAAQYNLAVAYIQTKQNNLALELLLALTKTDMSNDRLFALIAKIYQKQQKYGLAISNLEHAIQLNSNDSTHYLSLADVFYIMKNYDHADKYYQASINLAPNQSRATLKLARLNIITKKNPVETISLLKNKKYSGYLEVVRLNMLARSYMPNKLNDAKLIIADLETPSSLISLTTKAMFYAFQGDFNKAISLQSKIIELSKDHNNEMINKTRLDHYKNNQLPTDFWSTVEW